MKAHHMKDASAVAGGPGYGDLPIRRVLVDHPTIPNHGIPAYECEFEFEAADVISIMGNGKLRIRILGTTVVPIHVEVVSE
jgi:hypothetical protein